MPDVIITMIGIESQYPVTLGQNIPEIALASGIRWGDSHTVTETGGKDGGK
jgi:hypothetical protein